MHPPGVFASQEVLEPIFTPRGITRAAGVHIRLTESLMLYGVPHLEPSGSGPHRQRHSRAFLLPPIDMHPEPRFLARGIEHRP